MSATLRSSTSSHWIAANAAPATTRSPKRDVPAPTIPETVAAGLSVPAQAYFGRFGLFAGLDMLVSSDWTRSQLGWQPTGPELIGDLEAMDYSPTAVA
ncbi:hypothetical protein [Sphingomonas prati]|uniref:Uncharacterized protein n=1 Tax=Sphingomonas prati TaxID=1843237 RepID=A0A7W9F449_9SPHN|nr:hypothetical protein [Sphingomonas prati]MBB5730534.1 hypothetical protein [Sphingomonas prati]GGE94770.1 hypothetical protein GCM10011404_29840 [Sphingomonas prati]